MKNPSNIDDKWWRKTEELFDNLSIKKPPDPIGKTEGKIEDKDKYKSSIKNLLTNEVI